MISTDFTFQVGISFLKGTIDKPNPKTPVRWLSLHGAGTAHRGLVSYIAEHLASKEQALMRFDFSGHGESSGTLKESSLTSRLDEAKAALQFLDTSAGICLIGSSMGGHVAARTSHAFSRLRVTFATASNRQQVRLGRRAAWRRSRNPPPHCHQAADYASGSNPPDGLVITRSPRHVRRGGRIFPWLRTGR